MSDKLMIFLKQLQYSIHLCPVGQFIPEHHTLPGHKSHLMAPDHLGGIEFDLQLVWSAQTFDSPYQLWRATSSYSRYQTQIQLFHVKLVFLAS